MSKEFEEIVLKKLEKLDVLEVQMKQNNQRLGNLETEVKDVKKGLKDTNQRLSNLEVEVKNTKQGLQDLATQVKDSNQGLGKLEIEVKDTGEVVMDIRQRFTKFDYEINKKIDTLFDAYTVNQEKHSSFKEDIDSLNSKTFNHDIRISNLENKVLTA